MQLGEPGMEFLGKGVFSEDAGCHIVFSKCIRFFFSHDHIRFEKLFVH